MLATIRRSLVTLFRLNSSEQKPSTRFKYPSMSGHKKGHSPEKDSAATKKACHDDIRNQLNGEHNEGKSAASANASLEMCYYCFDVLHSYLYELPPPARPKFTDDSFPLFVTWTIGKDKRLRGCVGTFEASPLHDSLQKLALTSALEDSRFSKPISKEEFEKLHVSVSLLVDFEPCDDYLDWQIGKHGIQIDYKGTYKSTFLPEVALEHDLSQLETVKELLKKAHYYGPVNETVLKNIRVTRYRSDKVAASYQDYINAKENV